jgi:hypothetical protein
VSVLTSSLISSTVKRTHYGCGDGAQSGTCSAPEWQIIIIIIKSKDNKAESRSCSTYGDCAAMSACLFLQWRLGYQYPTPTRFLPVSGVLGRIACARRCYLELDDHSFSGPRASVAALMALSAGIEEVFVLAHRFSWLGANPRFPEVE